MKYEPPYDDFDLTAKPSTLKLITSSAPSNVTFVDFKRKKVMPAQDDKSEKIKRILASVANFTNTNEGLGVTLDARQLLIDEIATKVAADARRAADAAVEKSISDKKALQVILDRADKLDW